VLKRSDVHGPGSLGPGSGAGDRHESDVHSYIYGNNNGARQRNSRTGGGNNQRLDI
jgi:hypothetical protein